MLLVNESEEAESEIQTGKWMWWQFEEDGKEVNNMGLPIAIFYYESGHSEVAVLRGVEVAEEEPAQSAVRPASFALPSAGSLRWRTLGLLSQKRRLRKAGKAMGVSRRRTATVKDSRLIDTISICLINRNARCAIPLCFSNAFADLCQPIYSITLETTQMIEGRISCAEYRLELAPKPVSYTHLTLPTNREV